MKRISVAACAILLGGCFNDTAAPRDRILYGRYVLRTLDGDPVPAIFSQTATSKLEIMKGVITLKEDGTFTDSTDVRRTTGADVRRTIDVAAGTYVHNGDLINLSSTRGERYQMTVSERTLEQKLGSATLVYRK